MQNLTPALLGSLVPCIVTKKKSQYIRSDCVCVSVSRSSETHLYSLNFMDKNSACMIGCWHLVHFSCFTYEAICLSMLDFFNHRVKASKLTL